MAFPSLLVIQAGTPPEEIRGPFGDLPTWFCRALDRLAETVEVIRVFEGEVLPPPDAKRAAVITGSWSMVTDRHPWSEATAQWIREAMAVDMPLFGVCYGHQLMAHALGGRVDYHPGGREIGCQMVHLLPAAASDPLLEAWPSHFAAHLTHEQTVVELPPGAQALAFSAHDQHQIVRYGPRAISTQFHPEFTPEVSAACIRRRADILLNEGKDPEALVRALEDTREVTRMLRRFVELAC
ncbi:glutamine amidotransferase [Ralstonia solanacearum]|uniref:glutamine amidotransferase n=1 Tax=Ralstonia solanacearum TaxID=305 RepID=UPI0009BB6479|nr:glutamine amidotransferase [Ralstonia solanacearum]